MATYKAPPLSRQSTRPCSNIWFIGLESPRNLKRHASAERPRVGPSSVCVAVASAIPSSSAERPWGWPSCDTRKTKVASQHSAPPHVGLPPCQFVLVLAFGPGWGL